MQVCITNCTFSVFFLINGKNVVELGGSSCTFGVTTSSEPDEPWRMNEPACLPTEARVARKFCGYINMHFQKNNNFSQPNLEYV